MASEEALLEVCERTWRESTHHPDVLEELKARRSEEVVYHGLLLAQSKQRTKDVVLDQVSVVEVIVSTDTRSEETQRG